MNRNADKLSPFVATSAMLHVGLVALVLFGPGLFPSNAESAWGTTLDRGVKVGVASDLPTGIPLPSPPVVDESAKPTQTKSLHAPEVAPKTTPKAPDKPADVKIPERNAKKPPKSDPSAKPGVKSASPPPPAPDSNAVPGEGRPVDLPYGSPNGGEKASFGGDGTFGTRFPDYVTAMTRAIDQEWRTSRATLPPGNAKRVYVTFVIDRDGRVSDLALEQKSGSLQLDNSAQKAVLTAKLRPLPKDYRGSTVQVRFYFDYSN